MDALKNNSSEEQSQQQSPQRIVINKESTNKLIYGGGGSNNESDSSEDLLSPLSYNNATTKFGNWTSEYGNRILRRFSSTSSSVYQSAASFDTEQSPLFQQRDPSLVERNNLLNITKLVIKELIEYSVKNEGRSFEGDLVPLQHFFIVLEHAMRHGLKPKKGLLGPKKELWDVLQLIEKLTSGAGDITNSIRDLPTVSSSQGRARAFLRLALMQKKLADYFKLLIDCREILSDFYEPFALMMCEEGIVLGGLLVGLNVVDCCFCLKEEDQLDSQQGVIDFSLYLRSTRSSSEEEETFDNQNKIGVGDESVMDQKCYIEELNRHLNATVSNLQSRLETLTTTNALLSEDLSISKKTIAGLSEENKILRNNGINNEGKELEEEEKDLKIIQLENELAALNSKTASQELAMEKLEQSVHEKQENLISLRKQLEEIKSINLEMYRKLQDCEGSLKFKKEFCEKLECKVEEVEGINKKFDEKNQSLQKELQLALGDSRSVCVRLAEKELQLTTAETELKVEREWRINLQNEAIADKKRIELGIGDLKIERQRGEDLTLSINMASVEINNLRKQLADNEITLEEMGVKVKEGRELLEEYRENGFLSSRWMGDGEIRDCTHCKKGFSLTRRRHHCRSCGQIFCSDCSDNMMELPSSKKPVRVCDTCFSKGLSRFTIGGGGQTQTNNQQ